MILYINIFIYLQKYICAYLYIYIYSLGTIFIGLFGTIPGFVLGVHMFTPFNAGENMLNQ